MFVFLAGCSRFGPPERGTTPALVGFSETWNTFAIERCPLRSRSSWLPALGWSGLRHIPTLERVNPELLVSAPVDSGPVVRVLLALHDPLRISGPLTTSSNRAAISAMAPDIADRVRRLISDRGRLYDKQLHALDRLGVKEIHRYWSTQALIADIPRRNLLKIAARPEVRFVAPLRSEIRVTLGSANAFAEPHLSGPRTLAEVAEEVGFHAYPGLDLDFGRIRVLENGVNLDHKWLRSITKGTCSAPEGVRLRALDARDLDHCANAVVTESRPCHGTATASVLVSGMPDPDHGLHDGGVDLYKVTSGSWFGATSNGSWTLALDRPAIIAALEDTLVALAPIVLGEAVEEWVEDPALEGAVRTLFDGGAAFLMPTSNQGPSGLGETPEGPNTFASLPLVLGVGARVSYDQGAMAEMLESFGRPGGRGKPDIQCLADMEVAGYLSDSTDAYYGTSGAGAVAAAAAAWLRARMSKADPLVAPGCLYAALIACGDEHRPFPTERGAGLLRLPHVPMHMCWGALQLSSNSVAEAQVTVEDNYCQLQVGLWWPEAAPLELAGGWVIDRHLDFDLELIGPGHEVFRSCGREGVFERLTVLRPKEGTWTVRVLSRAVGIGRATAYVTAIVSQ